ncbi:MAG: hypothetical protein K2X93_24635 [Candidatus Obscuribacterales bacterium]|nr:hypothetical protein [Candidatus Obscuribacterales bacterium]
MKKESKKQKKVRVRRIKRLAAGFKRRVKTESDAIAYILDLYRKGDGFQCTCGNVLSQDIRTRKTKCGECNRDCWVTAGTMFDHAKKLRPYLIAVFLKTNGVDFQKGELATVSGVSDSTADEIIKKIAFVIVDQMTGDFQEFSSIAFLEIYHKRSRATPPFAHPRAEEDEFEIQRQANPAQSEVVEIRSPVLPPEHARVFDAIPIEEAITFNRLLDITQLTIPQLSESLLALQIDFPLIRLVAGDRYSRLEEIPVQSINHAGANGRVEEIGALIEYVNLIHGGVARKYLQCYAANHWWTSDPERWNNKDLFQACLNSKPKTGRDIVLYVSPANIKVSRLNLKAAA